MTRTPVTETASGVQALIDRIREEAVGAARVQAETIVAEARAEAARIVDDARTQVEAWTKEAENRQRIERESGVAALEGAARDVHLHLREKLADFFREHTQRVVARALEDEALLREVILAIAGRLRAEVPSDAALEILVTGHTEGNANRRVGEARLDAAVLGIARDMLRDGVTLAHGTHGSGGVRIRVEGEDVELVLDEGTLTELLLRAMLPRYASLLRGDV